MVSTRTQIWSLAVLIFCISFLHTTTYAITSLANNDPFPIFTTIDPQTDRLLLRKSLLSLDPLLADFAAAKRDCFNLSISPFAQSSSSGKDIQGRGTFAGQPIELGDITSGRTSMLGLMFGQLPEGKTFPPFLQNAFNVIFPTLVPGTLDDGSKQDCDQLFAFFSFPVRYNKRGLAIEVSFMIGAGIGGMIETRVSSIRQTSKDFNTITLPPVVDGSSTAATRTDADSALSEIVALSDFDQVPHLMRAIDETPNATQATVDRLAAMGITKTDVENLLMKNLYPIAWELGIDLTNLCGCTSIEEVRFSFFWRDYFELNLGKEPIFPHLSVDPYIILTGSISPGEKNNPSKRFAVPFGNNGFNALGFDAGLNFNFVQTVEVGGEIGFTHFFDRVVCGLRVPTSKFQFGMFPWTVDAKVQPGYNWHFALKLSAYHFLDNLSMYFQYVIVEHKCDCIHLLSDDPAFMPFEYEKFTTWKVKLANIGFNYDISPNISLGFLWQAPISQRNAYKCNTVMLNFNATI